MKDNGFKWGLSGAKAAIVNAVIQGEVVTLFEASRFETPERIRIALASISITALICRWSGKKSSCLRPRY